MMTDLFIIYYRRGLLEGASILCFFCGILEFGVAQRKKVRLRGRIGVGEGRSVENKH